ncbi:MAG: hypothetical protein PHP35_00075 [Candidatus Colwellbacteria bacterium]|nr:hypothetical protein [Candidatus Colwellbacteria bacterium]
MLEEFVAVTKNSIYLVQTIDGIPYANKLKGREGSPSRIAVGESLNEKHRAPLLSIGRQLIFFFPDNSFSDAEDPSCLGRHLEYVDPENWRGMTSDILGLFSVSNEDEAYDCFNAENRQEYDIRWTDEARDVLKQIGNEHPVFKICWETLLGVPSCLQF